MPLPVAHALGGVAIYAALDADGSLRPTPRLVAAVVLANAPDLDMIPGILTGDPNRFHHGLTHSLLAALVVGVVAAGIARGTGRGWPLRTGRPAGAAGTLLIVAALWASHVFLDMLTHDPSPPMGVPALWPMVIERVTLAPLFARADKVTGPASAGEFVLSLLSRHNLAATLREMLLLGPVVVAARWWRRTQEVQP